MLPRTQGHFIRTRSAAFTAVRSISTGSKPNVSTVKSKSTRSNLHTATTSVRNPESHVNPQSGLRKAGYLDSLSTKLLFSYAAVGLCTINKPILNTVIKLFPLIPTPILDFFIGKIYCGGSSPAEVIQTGEALSKRGINNMMLSLTIEDSEGTKNIDIDYIVDETLKSIDTILKPHLLGLIESGNHNINELPPGYIVLKPSALISNPAQVLLNFDKKEFASKWKELNDNCAKVSRRVMELNEELSKKYPERKSPFFVTVVDAEKFDLQQGVYQLQRSLFEKFNPIGKPVSVVGTIQMYLKQSMDQIKIEETLATKKNYRVGLKLVRGAYIHSEKDREVIHNLKQDTDIAYNSGIQHVLQDLNKNSENAILGHLVVATHNEKSSRLATDLLSNSSNPYFKANVVLGQLLGMCDDVTYDLIENRNVKNVIKYVPWGPPVETKDYLLRRLQENGDAVRSDNGWPLVKNVFTVYFKRIFGQSTV